MRVSGRSRDRDETQHIASSSADGAATYCVRGRQRAGGEEADPELPFFGSLERRRRIDAGQALIKEDCCEKRIIVFLERNSPDYCSNCISKPDRGSATKWHLSFSP